MTKTMAQLVAEITGLARAKTIDGAFVHTTRECEKEILMMLKCYTLVPKTPTQEMIEAHQDCCAGDADEAGPDRIKECWHEMIEVYHGL